MKQTLQINKKKNAKFTSQTDGQIETPQMGVGQRYFRFKVAITNQKLLLSFKLQYFGIFVGATNNRNNDDMNRATSMATAASITLLAIALHNVTNELEKIKSIKASDKKKTERMK